MSICGSVMMIGDLDDEKDRSQPQSVPDAFRLFCRLWHMYSSARQIPFLVAWNVQHISARYRPHCDARPLERRDPE